ncbi:MAG: M23 family metallopeptidase [bacterium]|nr:M23 family metallopeptidase [bacterium]
MKKLFTIFFLLTIYECVAIMECNASEELFQIEQLNLIVPVTDASIEQFFDRSILYRPTFIVQDGLPWYGAIRDDWYPHTKPRKHYGVDYYADTIFVLAMEKGTVLKVGKNRKAGGNVRILHSDSIETMYLHLSKVFVWNGKTVQRGDTLGIITKPEGNAYQTQLHFSIVRKGKFINPFDYLKTSIRFRETVQRRLMEFQKTKIEREWERKKLVEEFNRFQTNQVP